jgi:tetratricopeptide (TPR) repeat protein
MNPKASATLEKACEERRRSNFKKALARLEEGIEKFPREFGLYTEAIDVGLESGESLKAIQLFKKARQMLPDDAFELWTFTAEKVQNYNDPIVGRFLLEQAIKSGDLAAASSVLESLKDHAVGELLEHIRTKKQTMSLAMATGLAARAEVGSYGLTEALLCLRLGRLPEAMEGLVHSLDENPSLIKSFESFLADAESKYSDSADASLALGCCLMATGDHFRGLSKLSRAARAAPSLLPRVVERIERLREQSGFPIDLGDLTLAQLFVVHGDVSRALELLKKTIERTPSKASDAVDILKPAVDQVGEDINPHFVFVEACFAAGRRETALSQLRKIHRDKRHRDRLVEWLESRNQSGLGSIETQLFFAETLLNEGMHSKAIEIAEEILSHGSQEEPAIKELLSRHESVALVREYCAKKFGESPRQEKNQAYQFECYDSRGFSPRDIAPAVDKDPEEAETSRGSDRYFDGETPFRPDEPSFDRPRPAPPRSGQEPSADFDNREFSLSMHDSPPPTPAEPVGEETESPAGDESDLLDYLKRDFSGTDSTGDSEDRPAPGRSEAPTEPNAGVGAGASPAEDLQAFERSSPIGEWPPSDRVRRTAAEDVVGIERAPTAAEAPPQADMQRLQEIPAAPEQRPTISPEPIEARPEEPALPGVKDADTPSETEPAKVAGTANETETASGTEAAGAAPAAQPESPPDFDSLYQSFIAGRLDHGRMLEAAGRALDEARMKEMKEILAFEPSNLGEDVSRKYMLAAYYLAVERPLQALVVLRSVHLNALGREERKNFMLRIAQCYRELHNFEAAHSVFLRILGDHPGSEDVERMAKSNYARYIEAAAGAVPALEKVSTV